MNKLTLRIDCELKKNHVDFIEHSVKYNIFLTDLPRITMCQPSYYLNFNLYLIFKLEIFYKTCFKKNVL